MKNREGLGTSIMQMTSDRHKVDVHVGGVPNYKLVCDKPYSEFLTGNRVLSVSQTSGVLAIVGMLNDEV